MTQKKADYDGEPSFQSAELFHLLVENIEDYAVFMISIEGSIISWNPGVEKVLGYAEKEFVGQPVDIIFTAEDAAAGASVKEREEAAEKGRVEGKRWHKRRDESLFRANGMIMPVKNADGTLRGFAKVVRDDTEQKLLEERLRESEEFNRTILDSSLDCIKVLDLDGKLLSMNAPGLCVMEIDDFGDFRGRRWADFWRGDEHEKALAALESAGSGEVGRFRGFAETAKGTRKYWDVIVSPILDPNGEPKQILSVSRDISEQKRNEQSLAESNRRAETVLESITDAFFGLDRDWRFTFLNEQSEPLLRRKREELLGKSIWDEFPEAVGTAFYEQYHKAAAEQVTVVFEEFYPPLDSWFEVRAYPLPDGLSVYFHKIDDRKRAEENLIFQKTLLEALTESVADGILIVSPEGKLLHFNQNFIKIWNFPAEIVESQSDARALEWAANQTANPEAFLARVGTVYEHPDSEVREEVSMKDGRVFERFGAPIHGGNAEIRIGWVWTFRNITHRKRTETNLAFLAEVSHEMQRLTGVGEIMQTITGMIGRYLGVSNCIFAEVDTAANSAVVNYNWQRDDTAVDLTGTYKLSEFVSDEFRRTLMERKPVVIKDVAADPRTADNPANFQQLKIGSFINMPFVSEGNLKFILGVSREQPYEWRDDEIELLGELMARVWTRVERARAEENLRESEARLRALADSIPQLAWMAEPDGFIFWYNRRWYEYTGTTPEEMKGWGWQSVHDAETLPDVMKRWQASIQTGEPFEMEFPLRRGADGALRWFLTRVVPLRDTNGRIVRWFGTNTDIEELRQARFQAEQANRLKDEFLATLSHELRTPLNAILGWSQMLQNQSVDEAATKNALATIERNARFQSQLIDDILDVSRIITGKLRLSVRAVDLSGVITAAIDAVRPAAEAKNIRLQTLLDSTAGPISGDPDRLQQVTWNLLSNAIKFTPKGGRVQIRLERINSHVEIVVSDSGKGIEPEFLSFVFDRFRQSDGSMTRRHGGLGLGLAIVRQLVELHGGTVAVESPGEGRGATFRVFLPLLPIRTEPVGALERVHPAVGSGNLEQCPPELNGLNVLVVDDEADSRDLIYMTLGACGAKVIIASSAAEAFETIRQKRFDVIISDIGMPGEDGFSLMRKIRQLPGEKGAVPAIALTAYARSEDRIESLRAGFQMHVPKPVENTELIAAVANLAGRFERHQAK